MGGNLSQPEADPGKSAGHTGEGAFGDGQLLGMRAYCLMQFHGPPAKRKDTHLDLAETRNDFA